METPPILNYSGPPLTRFQRKSLTWYLKYHDKPPTLGRLLLRSWWIHAIMLIVGVGIAASLFYLGMPSIGMLGLGMMLGAVLRDIRHFRNTVMVWLVLEQVIDWGRIKQLLGGANEEKALSKS
jgi:hypothetical protein